MINKTTFFLLVWPLLAFANEGMWMPNKIDSALSAKMMQMGFQLAPDSIYNSGNDGLIDAVVVFGPGCTGEVVSSKGLIFTNHHCGFGSVQKISTVEKDYLYDGYWAKLESEEINVPDLSVKFLRGIFDVTDEILGCLPDSLEEQDRKIKIDSSINALKAQLVDTSDFLIEIKPFYNGLQYYATFQQVYTDIRLVATPPVSIGKFGGDTDNWMWPRHTGDFSVWRVYADSVGNPTDYNKKNVPLKTDSYLPVSLNGVKPGDFTMTLGYPGSTKRYLSSWGIIERMKVINQTLIDVRGVKQEVWSNRMALNNEIRLKYANKYFRSSNYWKNSIGMNQGLQRLGVIDKKRAKEHSILKWAELNGRTDIVEAVEILQDAYDMRSELLRARLYIRECLLRGAEIYSFSHKIMKLVAERTDSISNEKAIAEAIENFYKNYDTETDKITIQKLLKFYIDNNMEEYYPLFIQSGIKQNIAGYCTKLFRKSLFVDKSKLERAIAKNRLSLMKNDMAFTGVVSIREKYMQLGKKIKPVTNMISSGERALMEARLLLDSMQTHYPDANFTMRLSLGQVVGYRARDAVEYNYFTTAKGVLEKYKPDDLEFDLPESFVKLLKGDDFGVYGNEGGDLPVCFISNNDITGGNSGSPVINGKGKLVGLAFDGNWEAMSGDIAFEPELQRTIAVDIRYVIYIIDNFGNCDYILEEMDLIKRK